MRIDTSGKVNNRRLAAAIDVLLAILLGSACFYVFISMFGLKWPGSGAFSGSLQKGFAGIWDKMADRLGRLDYVILVKYKAKLTSGGAPVCGTALTLTLAAFSAISYFIIKSKNRLLLLIFVIPLTLSMMVYGLRPSVFAGAYLTAALIIVLAVMRMDDELEIKSFIVPCAMLAACLIVLALISGTVSLKEPAYLAETAGNIKASIIRMRYGTDPLPSGDLARISGNDLKRSRGDIESIKSVLGSTNSYYGTSYGADYSSDAYSDADKDLSKEKAADDKGAETALSVGMSRPESYYLRGFTGGTYRKNKWSTLPNDAFYSMRDRIFWLNRRDFDGLSQMSRAAYLGGTGSFADADDTWYDTDIEEDDEDKEESSGKGNSINIIVKSASRRFAFIPYELHLEKAGGKKARKSEMKLPSGTKNYGGSHLGTEGITGKSSYSYVADTNLTGSWTDVVGKLYTALQTEAVNEYFISESHYNVMQYENYLSIPGKVRQQISQEVGSPGDISEDHADYKETIDRISGYISANYTYSDTFAKPAGKEDFIQKFMETKSGSDMHFATLAALLFRYYGIPARYVEGYLITPHMIQSDTSYSETDGEGTGVTAADAAASGTEVDVPRAASHAWTEIYIDGFGWVPYEATPEYRGMMQEADMTIGLQNVDYEVRPPEPPEPEDTEPEEDDEESELTGKKLKKLLRNIIILLIISALMFILIRYGRWLFEERRWRKAFRDKDPGKAIRALYQYASLHKWKLSEDAEALGLMASYSGYRMQEADRKIMQTEFEKAKEQYKKEKSAARAKARAGKLQTQADLDINEAGA